MDADLAAQTLDRATTALRSSQISCLPEIVKLLRTLAGNSDEVSVAELGDVIQNDAVIMSKVISAANTLYYNPNAVPISGVIQAIHVIGYERIRSLAMSLMLAEQAARGRGADEQREIAAQALVAGCLAQSIAADVTFVDRDQAFVCGCLRCFGQVVMANCMLEQYQHARNLAAGTSEDEAYTQVFGLTPLELGYNLLKAANLPDEILTTLRALPPESLAVLDHNPDEQLRAVAECSDRMAKLACNPKVSPEEFAAQASTLAHHFERLLPDLAAGLPDLMQTAMHKMDDLVRTLRLRTLPNHTMSRMRSCRNAVDPKRAKPPSTAVASSVPAVGQAAAVAEVPLSSPAASPTPTSSSPPSSATPSAGAAAKPGPSPESAPAAAPASEPPRGGSNPPMAVTLAAEPPLPELALPAHDWQSSTNRLATLLCESGMTPDRMQRALLELVCSGLGAPHGLIFSRVPHRRGYGLTQGRGTVYGRLKDQAAVTVQATDRNVLGVCLQRKDNINIHHAHEPKITAYFPSWLKGQDDLGAFVLMPLTDGVQVHGVVLAGWNEACRITLSPDCLKSLRTMIALVCKAGVPMAA